MFRDGSSSILSGVEWREVRGKGTRVEDDRSDSSKRRNR